MENFSIYQEQIFRKLRNGTNTVPREEFFFNVIQREANVIAGKWNSEVILSPTRTAEAQDLWETDLRALISDKKIENSSYPCEYKHAAFLCFWLRRRVVIESAKPKNVELRVTNKDFNSYKNEFISLHIALNLVFYHAYFPKEGGLSIERALSGYEYPKQLVHEAVVLLHHKNVSPHALYLIFRALMTSVHPAVNNGLHAI